MSICPSNDIHSIYLDNELPEIYKAEYEKHLESCPECQKKLAKLKALHELMNSDSNLITPDSHYLDQSFDRLMVKMNYAKTIEKSSSSVTKSRYFIPSVAAAAAALFLAVALPLTTGVSKTKSANVAELFDFNSGSVSIEEQQNTLARMQPSKKYSNNVSNVSNTAFTSGRTMPVSGTIEPVFSTPKSVSVNNSNIIKNNDADLIEYDVFRPNFGEEKISIRITVPGVDTLPVSTEIELPLDVITGQH